VPPNVSELVPGICGQRDGDVGLGSDGLIAHGPRGLSGRDCPAPTGRKASAPFDRQRSTTAGVLGENPDARARTRRAVYAFAAAALSLDPDTIACRLCALPRGRDGAITSQTGPETEIEPEYASLAR